MSGDAQVFAWLSCAGLSRFAPRFAAAHISPPSFLQLSPVDLDALGVDGPADRKRLSDLISDLRRSSFRPAPSRANSLSVVPSSDARPVLESLSHRNSSSALVRNRSRLSIAMPISGSVPPAPPPPTLTSPPSREPTATVRVCVRKRPLSRKELSSKDRDIIAVSHEQASLVVHELKEKVDLTKYIEAHTFSFDNVFGEHAGNASVYDATARPLVDALFAGGRATCFAYGQTGAGKTFTMAGDAAENPGLYTLAVRDVFDRIRDLERDAWRIAEENGDDDFEPPDPPQVWISFYEIYASRLQDLLNRGAKLECREDANNEVQIIGLSERLCEVEEDVLALIKEGSALRSTGVTGANDDSSRSHAVFQIELRDPPPEKPEDETSIIRETLLRGTRPTSGRPPNKGDEIGRLCFIDLAGSERGSDTASSTRQTRMEGAEINKSLLALKECIRAMDKRKDHTPFRGSKLTQVLKASFMGKNCRTVMIANISPSSSNVEHTLNTLRYSDRVREIRKERGTGSAHLDGVKHNARRATFTHGIGIRGGRSGLALPPSSSKMTSPANDSVSLDEGPKRDRNLISIKIENDADDGMSANGHARSSARAATAGSTRCTTRPGSRVAEYPHASTFSGIPSESNGVALKNRDLRAGRGSKTGFAHMPSRPSMANSMLPRAHTKLCTSERVPRANSGLARMTSEHRSPGTEVDATTEALSRVTLRSKGKRDGAVVDNKGSTASPAMTRQRRRELEAMQEDKRSESPSDSREEDSPPEEVVVKSKNVPEGRRRGPRASNVAESAMRYYRTKKNELAEEDLLFASSDDMAEATDVSDKRRGLVMPNKVTNESEDIGSGGGVGESVVNTRATNRGSRKNRDERGGVITPSSSESETVSANSKMDINAEVKQVVRMHHMQIEELMRLTEADVALVNDMEKGKLDAQEYALKLSVNLSQKLDIVKTLQAKVKMLE